MPLWPCCWTEMSRILRKEPFLLAKVTIAAKCQAYIYINVYRLKYHVTVIYILIAMLDAWLLATCHHYYHWAIVYNYPTAPCVLYQLLFTGLKKQQARNRWAVAYTLVHNPSLRPLRATQLKEQEELQSDNHYEVTTTVKWQKQCLCLSSTRLWYRLATLTMWCRVYTDTSTDVTVNEIQWLLILKALSSPEEISQDTFSSCMKVPSIDTS